MPPKKGKTASAKGPVKKKVVANNGYKLPDPIEPGQILVDMIKSQWRLGKSIGQGGFGEIYLASNNVNKAVDDKADYVIKIEPHSNGPLFTEMHCYMRIGKPELIDAWVKEKKLKNFGMPKYLGSGSHQYKGQKYRFMVMERFGSDLQKILNKHDKKLSIKTVYQAGIQILDVLEYIHSKEYIHADIKASNLLLGYQPGTEDQVYLVDYGLACRYTSNGQHKPYAYDGRKAHDGTIEFTSRDAHIGAHSRRGDLEILGYNLVQWLCSQLPWEDNLQDCNYVAKQKRAYMDDIDLLLDKCFPDSTPPPGLKPYLEYVKNLTFDESPNYDHCRTILRNGLKARGYKDGGKLIVSAATPKAPKPKSRAKKGYKRRSDEAENICELNPTKQMKLFPTFPCAPSNQNKRVNTRRYHRVSDIGISLSQPRQPQFTVDSEDLLIELENQKMLARRLNEKPKRLNIVKDTSLDNPTPQMLAVMAKMREKSISPSVCLKRHNHNGHCVLPKSQPYSNKAPTDYTPEMEAVLKRKEEKMAFEDSEGYSSSSSSYSSYQLSVIDRCTSDSDYYFSEDSNDSIFNAVKFRGTQSRSHARDSTRDSRSSGSSNNSKRAKAPPQRRRRRPTCVNLGTGMVTRYQSRNASVVMLN